MASGNKILNETTALVPFPAECLLQRQEETPSPLILSSFLPIIFKNGSYYGQTVEDARRAVPVGRHARLQYSCPLAICPA